MVTIRCLQQLNWVGFLVPIFILYKVGSLFLRTWLIYFSLCLFSSYSLGFVRFGFSINNDIIVKSCIKLRRFVILLRSPGVIVRGSDISAFIQTVKRGSFRNSKIQFNTRLSMLVSARIIWPKSVLTLLTSLFRSSDCVILFRRYIPI